MNLHSVTFSPSVSLSKGHYAVDAAGIFTENGGEHQRMCEAGYACDGGNRTLCGENELPNGAKNACIPCKSCAVGEGLVAGCSDGVETQCAPCEDGQFSSGGTSTCELCKTNEISNTAKSACIPCTSCAVGQGVDTRCSGNVDTRCSPCVAGQFSPGGNSTCQPCVAGQFCPLGAYAPRPCVKGSFCNVTFIQGLPVWGTSEEPCRSGTYCPRGTFDPITCAKGATCTVPASPELVLDPVMFDLVESEVLGGSIQYQLSLSAQPNASVTVKIELNITSDECYAYNSSKIELALLEFEFGPDNYNISQIVVSKSLSSQPLFFLTITGSQPARWIQFLPICLLAFFFHTSPFFHITVSFLFTNTFFTTTFFRTLRSTV